MNVKKYNLEQMQIAHIGIITSNLEQYLETFKSLFKIEEIYTYDFTPIRAYTYGKEIAKCKLKIAIIESRDGFRFEIIEPVIVGTPHKKFLMDGNGGLNHIAFYTKKIDDCLKEFKNLGWDIIFEAEIEDKKGYRRCFYTKDEQLNCIYEFVEKPYKKER